MSPCVIIVMLVQRKGRYMEEYGMITESTSRKQNPDHPDLWQKDDVLEKNLLKYQIISSVLLSQVLSYG